MRHIDVRTEAASVCVSRTATTAASSFETSRKALFLIWARIGLHPATAFVFLSLAFGSLVAIVIPPLRGPDEISHFLRIYSYARGELLPAAEVDGRKGIFVDRKLYAQLSFFRSAGEWFATAREKDVRYGQVMALYRDAAGKIDDDSDQAAIFAPFAGTEGYTPIAYLPYIPAAAIGRLLRLDFPDLLLLMRLFGIAAFTALAAYAIRVSPVLKWGFVLIAMLPVSLYNRSVLSADGAALSSALVITALCLSAARKSAAGPIWERSLWMTLCALSKQPQIVFVLLELMTSRVRDLRQRWRRGDRLWPELIGILGWQDIWLRSWIYLVLTVFLLFVAVQRLQLDGVTRVRVTALTGLTVLGYVVVVYLIFFLTYTPLDVDHVRGVQGRYFIIILPVAAVFVAAMINRELPNGMPSAIAIAGSLLSGTATVEALFRAHW